jgi:hypothetical protein
MASRLSLEASLRYTFAEKSSFPKNHIYTPTNSQPQGGHSLIEAWPGSNPSFREGLGVWQLCLGHLVFRGPDTHSCLALRHGPERGSDAWEDQARKVPVRGSASDGTGGSSE